MINYDHDDNKRKEPGNQNTGRLHTQQEVRSAWVLGCRHDGKMRHYLSLTPSVWTVQKPQEGKDDSEIFSM